MTPRRVAIVKSAGRADAFAQAVRDLGLVPVLVSPFRFERIAEGENALVAELVKRPRWIAVTSPQAAASLEPFARVSPADALAVVARAHADAQTALAAAHLAAVGSGTATALQSAGLRPEVVGDAGGEALARRMVAAGLARGDVVLHPCGEDARGELSHTLRAAGATVVPVAVYRMVADEIGTRSVTGEFAAVVIGSPRLAQRAADLFPSRPPAIAVGRTTASALRDLGWSPAHVAATPTPEDVAGALRAVLGE